MNKAEFCAACRNTFKAQRKPSNVAGSARAECVSVSGAHERKQAKACEKRVSHDTVLCKMTDI